MLKCINLLYALSLDTLKRITPEKVKMAKFIGHYSTSHNNEIFEKFSFVAREVVLTYVLVQITALAV